MSKREDLVFLCFFDVGNADGNRRRFLSLERSIWPAANNSIVNACTLDSSEACNRRVVRAIRNFFKKEGSAKINNISEIQTNAPCSTIPQPSISVDCRFFLGTWGLQKCDLFEGAPRNLLGNQEHRSVSFSL